MSNRKEYPKVIDNDRGHIKAELNGRVVRDWFYSNDDERRRQMVLAREYVEGFGDAMEFGRAFA